MQEIEIAGDMMGDMIRLGQLVKLSGLADSGARVV
jgi:ribosome-associated protein YbcJ (S4-like RNA binding protein)